MRSVEDNPPDKALTLSEWFGMKIWQIATIPPTHSTQLTGGLEESRKWRYSQSGLKYLTEGQIREADRSRTPLRLEKGKDDPKGKGSGKKGKKPAKVIGTPEGEEVERVGKRYFPGPATLPEAWRDKPAEELVMSGSIEPNPGRATMIYKQGPNGIPIFRRSWAVSDAPIRKTRVLENKAGDSRLWDPTDKEFWSVCQHAVPPQDGSINYLTLSPGSESRCRLCPSARTNELVPCCWCESWVHWRCSYTVKSGRACASHFHVTNPLDKVVVTRSDDETVPIEHRGLQVVPNTFYPKASKGTLKPSDLMIGLETYWAYKHAWRGAGYYYRKGDHVPLAKGGTTSFANALSIVAAWETWYLPRPQPIDPVLIDSPDAWELDAHYLGGFEPHAFPPRSIPISMANREANLIGYMSPEKGNMWRLLYETSHSIIQKYWKYAHHYAVQHSHTNNEYYSWDKFVEELPSLDLSGESWSPPIDFDPRFYYYSKSVNLTEDLSTEKGRQTTEEEEVGKTGSFSMNEFPSLEMKLIPEDLELEKGKKRGLEGAVQPPPQERRKGGSRGSSVPPGSATDLARQRAQATNLQTMKGKGSTKGTSQGKDMGNVIMPVGKLPPEFQAMSSTEKDGDMPLEDRRKKIFNRTYYGKTWDILQGYIV